MTTPVVLVHGARVSRTMWRAQVTALERAGVPALAVDLPGHGTRTGERFTVDGCVETVAQGVDGLGGRALVVGLSLGGYVGIRHAACHPEQVAGLVAAGCSAVPDQAFTTLWLMAVKGFFERLPDRGAWFNQRLAEAALPADGLAAVTEGGFALEVMVDLLTGVRELDPLADLARVACPVWLVNGQWDHFRISERRFAAAAPDARVVVIPRATHLASLVQPVAFTRAVLQAHEEVERREASRAVPALPVLPVGQAPGAHPARDPG